jgi:signal transduction histidine kinase
VLTALNGTIFSVTLHFTENMVFDRQIHLLYEQFQDTYPDWEGPGPLKFHGATIYSSVSQLPLSIRKALPKQHSGVVEIPHNGMDTLILTVDIDSNRRIVVMEIAAMEISEEDDTLITILFFGFTSITLLLALYVVHITAEKLSRPLNRVTEIISQHNHLSKDVFNSLGSSPTELSMLVDALVQLQERVDQHIERERQFTGFASHELRTPLAVIKATSGLLQLKKSTHETQRHYQRLHQGIKDMESLIDTFLRLAREKRDVHYHTINLNEHRLLSIVDKFNHLLSIRDLSVNLSVDESIEVESPETVISVLLDNLIKNAITHSADGVIYLTISKNTLSITNPCLPNDLPVHTNEISLEIRQHGIGLNIVAQACDYFGWDFSFEDNGKFVTASVTFP